MIHVKKVFGIWIKILKKVVKPVHVTPKAPSTTRDAICILANVPVSDWSPEKTATNAYPRHMAYRKVMMAVVYATVIQAAPWTTAVTLLPVNANAVTS